MINFSRHSLLYAIVLSGMLCFVNGVDGAQAQLLSKTGTSSAQFLNIPVGARSAALGSAGTASIADATAMYWNPGALVLVGKREVMVEHSEWFADTRHNFAGVALPLGRAGVVGLYMLSLTMDKMEETTMEQPQGTGRMFGAYNYTVGLSYARYLMTDFSIGATVKYVHESIWNSNAGGFAVDFGTRYVTPFDGIRLGVRLANFGQKMNIDGKDLTTTVDIDPGSQGNNNRIDARLSTREFDLPLMLQVGLAWDAWQSRFLRATLMADAVSPSDANQSVNLGVELSFFEELFSLQAGLPELLLGDDRMFRYALGGAVHYELDNGLGLNLGYAMQSHEYLGITNRFSFKVIF